MKTGHRPAWGPPSCTVLAPQNHPGHCCLCVHSPGSKPKMSSGSSSHSWQREDWKLPPKNIQLYCYFRSQFHWMKSSKTWEIKQCIKTNHKGPSTFSKYGCQWPDLAKLHRTIMLNINCMKCMKTRVGNHLNFIEPDCLWIPVSYSKMEKRLDKNIFIFFKPGVSNSNFSWGTLAFLWDREEQ